METKIIGKNEIEKAVLLLKASEVVGVPTETVYGLGANAFDKKAIEKTFKAKGRPQDNPLIVHVSNEKMLNELVRHIPNNARKLMDAFWPGALTIVFKKSENVIEEVSKGLKTVAVRMPKHETMLKLIELCGFPISAPSANISGRPSTTTFLHVYDDLQGKIAGVIEDDECEIGVESTVIDTTKEIPVLLRPGGVTKEQIESVIGKIKVDKSITEIIDETSKVSSPGMKYKHYAPKAKVIVLEGNPLKTSEYIKENITKNDGALVFDEFKTEILGENTKTFGKFKDKNAHAKNLFAKLREFDETDVTRIFAQCPQSDGIGLAVVNRLKKSSGFNVQKNEGKVIGLTGESGSGKTTASEFFAKKGYKILNADEIYHKMLAGNEKMQEEIAKNFEKACMSGKIDRKELAKIVFEDKAKLKLLNEITHKYVINEIKIEILNTKSDILIDAPQLFEAKLEVFCDKTIGIISNNTLERIVKRDNITEEDAKKRIKNQKNDSFYTERCDIIIENNGEICKFEEYLKIKGEKL